MYLPEQPSTPPTPSTPPAEPARHSEALPGPTLRLFWQTAAQYPVRLTLSLLLPVMTVLIGRFAGPAVIAVLLTRLQNGTVSLDNATGLILIYAFTQFIGGVVGWRITLYAMWSAQVEAMAALYRRVFSHLTRQSLAFHSDRFSGSLVSQTNKLTGSFERFWDMVVWEALPVTTTVVAACAILGFILPWYALFLGLMSAMFTATVLLSSRRMERLNVLDAQASTDMTGYLADVTTNIAAVKAAGAERAEDQGAAQRAQVWTDRNLDVMRSFLVFSTGFSMITATTNTAALLAAVVASEHAVFPVAAVYLAITYTLSVTDQLWSVTQVARDYNRVMGDAHDMVEILGMAESVTDLRSEQFVRGAGTVDFDHLAFSHADTKTDALFDDFTLHIEPGEKIGLVGHSGSGKSTLVRLLLRFSDVDAGAIRIDGQDLREVTQASLRQQIAYVSQEPLLFHRSIRENIAYARPSASDAEIHDAAVRASADEFIAMLPEGYDTLVGERGVKLSGGQRQRVAIARAVLQDAELLVLDEATSALDSESEAHIQAALNRAMQGRTTIVIAHRLSTIQAMDRIVVLAEGRIVEQGTHRGLLARGGTYAGLWSHQSGGFLQ
ncbi:MAG: ABC transporter ATP-binding protein [Candidatus Nanopelagicales bacterium]